MLLVAFPASNKRTCYVCYAPTLTAAKQAGTWLTDPGGTEGWVDLSGWLYTEMV